ncbi:U2AF65B [Symbiodinium pilosum]|uniref:U2AF65B protein n=1 Tax=Symbiodinium pilosum TaxID=2952 RepID=A0A812K5Y6_SYMPI|nr:U2AF65B [Symbiodinium pilosum]
MPSCVRTASNLPKRLCLAKVLYLKNIVTAEDLADEQGYAEICADIRLEAEKFGAVVSIEVPRGGGSGAGGPGALNNALPAPAGPLALTNAPTEEPKPAAPAALPAPTLPDLSMALVPIGGQLAKPGGAGGGVGGGGASGPVDPNTPGFGFAFIEFANIEGAAKAKKALHGRRFGANNVEAEFFSEDKYYAKDFLRPTPNIDEPKQEMGMELALIGGGGDALDEAPVMVE